LFPGNFGPRLGHRTRRGSAGGGAGREFDTPEDLLAGIGPESARSPPTAATGQSPQQAVRVVIRCPPPPPARRTTGSVAASPRAALPTRPVPRLPGAENAAQSETPPARPASTPGRPTRGPEPGGPPPPTTRLTRTSPIWTETDRKTSTAVNEAASKVAPPAFLT